MKRVRFSDVLPSRLNSIEKWIHLSFWILGLVIVNWPGQQITIGLFQSEDNGLLIPSIYGTLINGLLAYGVINLMLEYAGKIDFNIMSSSLLLFLVATVIETIVDIGYLLLLSTAIDWTGLLDVCLTNLVIHFFFFYAPALIYGIIKSSSYVGSMEIDKIEIQDGHHKVLVSPDELSHVESDGNYVRFHTTRGVILERSSLINVEGRLPDRFIRCHKSFIVNSDVIEKILTNSVEVAGHRIPLGRKYKSNIV